MFYRRKLILALLQLFGGRLEKIALQKLLFLLTNKQAKPEYEFIPYKYGCYSHSANADLTVMLARGFLNEGENSFEKKDDTDYLQQLKPDDLKLLLEVKSAYGEMSSVALMKYTYLNFPFYATRSEVLHAILNQEESENVIRAKPKNLKTVLYTIGYEGISLEQYLVRLLVNDVKILVDVRDNPLSMKYGFSKSQLKRYCASLGIVYLHFPEVGIQSDQRQQLNSQTDYDKLFDNYRINNLTRTTDTQTEIFNLLKKHQRIALTCFEANVCQCHRKHLAEAIEKLPAFDYEVMHL